MRTALGWAKGFTKMSVRSKHQQARRLFTMLACGSERGPFCIRRLTNVLLVAQTSEPSKQGAVADPSCARLRSRACPELNESDGDRCAILNSVLPAWIQPMSPRQEGTLQSNPPIHCSNVQSAWFDYLLWFMFARRDWISKFQSARYVDSAGGSRCGEDVRTKLLRKLVTHPQPCQWVERSQISHSFWVQTLAGRA